MISAWYNLVDILLPFSWAQHIFMKNALLGVLLVTPIFGMLGTMVVNNRMAFFSDALGHSALTGIAIGVILGIKQPLWSMIMFSLLLTIAILIVKRAQTISTDTIIGVFSSAAIALGIVILSIKGGFSRYSVYLIGDLLSIKAADLIMLGIAFIILIFFWIFFFNKLLVASLNQPLAKSRGIKVARYEYFFTIIMALIITISIQWVGILVINSMLILPAAAARNIAQNIKQYHIISILIAVSSGLSGLILSYFWGTAAGASIVLISAMFFIATFTFKMAWK